MRIGVRFKRVLVLGTVAAIMGSLMASAVTRTVFSSLGEPVGGKSWPLIVALLIGLSISGVGSGIRSAIAPQFSAVSFVLSGGASGALLGFFYGGLAADENPQVAVVAAVFAGLLVGAICLKFRSGVVAVAVAIAAAITGYGLAFWLWVGAIAFWSGQKLIWGTIWTVLALACIGLTISSLVLAFQEIKKAAN